MKVTKKPKPKISEKNILWQYAKEQTTCFVIYISVFIISCMFVLVGNVNHSSMHFFATGTFIVSGFLCGLLYGFKSRKNGIVTGAKCVIVPTVLILIISLIMNKFDIEIINMLISTVLMFLSGIIGGVIGVNIRIKPNKRRK